MRLLALYANRTLSILRRIQAPFSTLSQRGHPFAFMQVPTFDIGHALGYDVTILPNWVLSQEEVGQLKDQVSKGCIVTYDLSDLALLQNPLVLATLCLCRMITVPNTYMQREVEIAAPGVPVRVVPSTVDIPYILTGNAAPMLFRSSVGCFGPYDWSLIKDALVEVRAQKPHLPILGDAGAAAVLGDLVTPVDIAIDTYPAYLHQCLFGLCPIEHERGQDRIWEQEYGMLCKPVLLGNAHKTKDQWVSSILDMARSAELRASKGQAAHETAKKHSTTRLADQYLRVYRENLPHLVAARYTTW